MTFHPDKHLPGCMMPDGGDCCAGHAAVCEDWHKQRREIEMLRTGLRRIISLEEKNLPKYAQQIARETLALSSQERNTP
jgi:hypothetical protein